MKTDKPARFRVGDRVAWIAPSERLGKDRQRRKTGTIMAIGKSREEAVAALKKGYQLGYQSARPSKGMIHLVAADTPLFRPGFVVHSVPVQHLQKEADSIEFKLAELMKLDVSALRRLAAGIGSYAQKAKGRAPKEIASALHEACPTAFPAPEKDRKCDSD